VAALGLLPGQAIAHPQNRLADFGGELLFEKTLDQGARLL
jgi:hypothetical protein